MKEGLWINYRTGMEFSVGDHEQWIRIPNNATKAGVPPNISQQFDNFRPLEDREAFLLFIINNVPLMRVRGHGSDVAFEYASRSRSGPLDTIFAWAKKNAGPFTTLRMVNFSTNENVVMLFKDFERSVSEGGYEAVMRAASSMQLYPVVTAFLDGKVSPRQLMAELDTEFCVRRAGSREEYLRSIGASPEILQYIVSQDPERSKWLTNQFRKNPQLSLEELSALQQAPVEDYTQREHTMANAGIGVPGLSEWIMIQLKKYRTKKIALPAGSSDEFEYRIPWRFGIETIHALSHGRLVWSVLNQIADWVRAEHVQISSYDLPRAQAESDRWHEEQKTKGAGGDYEEKNIVADLGTTDKKYTGWTIQEVRTEKDLEVEGNKMGHCVGSYCPSVEKGDTVIYSLRDPQNDPHVTIELNPDRKTIKQIQGKGNAEPILEYKKMIRAWVKTQEGMTQQGGGDYGDDLSEAVWNVRADAIEDLILEWEVSEEDEYGLHRYGDVRQLDVDDVFNQIMRIANERSPHNRYEKWMGKAGRALVQLLWSLDRKKPQIRRVPTIPGEVTQLPQSRIEALEKELQQREEKMWDSVHSESGYGPSPDDFETTEEFEKAEEKFMEEESDAQAQEMRQYVEGGMLHAMWDELNDLLHREAESKAAKTAVKTKDDALEDHVPIEVLRAWKRVHWAGDNYSELRDRTSLQYYTVNLQQFADALVSMGAITKERRADIMSRVKTLVGKYDVTRDGAYIHSKIDTWVNALHGEVLEKTLTPHEAWYDWSDAEKQKPKPKPQPVQYAPDPWLKELWEEKVRRERYGRRVEAEEHKGFFVALFLDDAAAKKLVQEGGEAADEMHVTLCYCEDVDKLGEEKIEKAFNVIRGVATEHAPLEGRVGGWGRFTGGKTNGKEVVYAVADVPGLTALREDLAERLTTIDVAPRDDHGYTPHITLKYVEEDEEIELDFPEEIKLSFTKIRIKAGDKIEDIDLSGPTSTREAMNRLSQKYPPDPWLKELWECRVRHERAGRRIDSPMFAEEHIDYQNIVASEQSSQIISALATWKTEPYQTPYARLTNTENGSKQSSIKIDLTWQDRDYPQKLEFYCFVFPLRERENDSRQDVERNRRSLHWFTDVEVFYRGDNFVYHRERSWKTQEEAERDFQETLDRLGGMTVAQFANMAKPSGGKLSSRKKCAAYPPGGMPSSPPRSKISPHDVFPGDTVKNKGEQDYWQPWDTDVQWDADGKYGEPFVNDRRGPGSLGVPVPTTPSVTDDNNTRKKVPRMFQSYSIAPILQQRNEADNSELLVRLPDDIHERYRDLASRVQTYARGVDLDSLDAYEYPQTPPQRWVEREMRKYPVDQSDASVIGGVLIQSDPADLVDWFDMRNLDEAKIQELAPNLHSQYVLENDGKKDFATWFIEDAPFRASDKTFVRNFATSIQENPKSTFGQRYETAWRKKNNEEITNTAHQSAREQWLDAIRGKVEFSRAEYRPHLETLHKLRNEERVPIHDMLSALEAIPIEDASIAKLRSERDSLVGEGMHAMDLYREPVSRDDRLLGDLEPVGERIVPVRRIIGEYAGVGPTANRMDSPLFLYQYGSAYFLVHESDAGRLQKARKEGLMCVTANVTKVTPGSSIRKRAALSSSEWQKKIRMLRAAIDEVSAGADKESVFLRYGREYGPGLRTAINDFLYVKSQQTENVRCANWENQQSADNCGNCTFWPNGGGSVEFGYGGNGCHLTDFFLNSPDSGFSRQSPTSYDSESNPPKQRNPRHSRIRPLAQEKVDEKEQPSIKNEDGDGEFGEEFLEPEIEEESPRGDEQRSDVLTPPAGTEIPTEPVSLDRLNDPQSQETLTQIYGRVGTFTPGTDTTERLRIYDLSPFVEKPDITKKMLSDTGFNVEYFSFEENPERGVKFRAPDLKRQGYDRGVVWIYDPRNDHGSFKDSEYTNAWRIFHEVGHGVTEQFMFNKYGPSKREGRLGVEGKKFRGKPPNQQAFATRPLSLMEAQRTVEWEDVTFRAQRILQEEYGVSVSDEDFAQETNINIIDAMYRVLTGDFGNPGENGFLPSKIPPNVHNLLQWLENQENALATQQGRSPTPGINLASWKPISDDEIRAAITQRKQQRRGVRQWGVVKRACRFVRSAQESFPGFQEVGDIHFKYSPEELNVFSAAALKRHQELGGSTFNLQRGDLSGKSFYALSLYPERTAILTGEIFAEDIREFIDTNADVFSDSRHSIGTWVNPDGNTELDVIVTIPSRFEALSLAKQYNQKAIMNLENYDVITMEKGTGESKKDMPEERYLEDIGARSVRADTQNFLSQIDWEETFEENFTDLYPQTIKSAPVDDVMSDTDMMDALVRPSTEESQRFVGAHGLIDEAIGSTSIAGAAKKREKPKKLPGLPPSAHPGLAIRPPDENQGGLFEEADPDVLRSKRGLILPAPNVYNSQQYQNVLKQAPVVPFDPSRPESIDESIAFLESTTGLQVRHQTDKMRPVEFFLFPTEFGDTKTNHVVYAAWFALYSANTAVSAEEKQFVTWQAGHSGSDPQKLGILSQKNKLIELLKFLKWAGFPKFERLDAVLDDFNPSEEAYQSRLLALSRQAGVQPKVGSFMLALLGDRRSPTLDMHAIGYLIGKGKMEVPEGHDWTPLRDLFEMRKKMGEYADKHGTENAEFQAMQLDYTEKAQANKKAIAAINAQTRINRNVEKSEAPGANPKILETEKRKIRDYMARQMEGWDGDTDTFWIWYSSNSYFETHEPRRDMIHTVFFQSLFPELFTVEALQQREHLREQYANDPEGLKQRLKYRDYLENLEEMRKIRKVKPAPVQKDTPELEFDWESGEFEVLPKAAKISTT